jgi:trans-2,3-dihydro-3-hydroxyanthranilate isomerase
MSGSAGTPPVTVVRACLRDGAGGSPTAVLDEAPMSEEERRRVPVLAGTSHAVFVGIRDSDGAADLRFFTAEEELPACGHGTVAALAHLAARTGRERFTLRAGGRVFTGRAVRHGARVEAAFDPGPVELREPAAAEAQAVLSALGVTADHLAGPPRAASVGRWRLLVPVTTRDALAALAPDPGRLRAACDRFGLLGAYVHSAPSPAGRLAARMFAPSIGVPEDIANANSTACLAAHLAPRGFPSLTVDMGDPLGTPATITTTSDAAPGSHPRIHVGGFAALPSA